MADSSIAVTAGTGTAVDTRTESTNGNHRQVVVIGDPSTNAGVAPVDATTGLSVNVTNTSIAVDASGHAVPVTDGGGSITVDNGGTFAVQATIANGATSIAKAEDDASANADVGVPAMAVRKATPANTSGTDGDYEMLQMSAGRLWTSSTVDAALPAGTNSIGAVTNTVLTDFGAGEYETVAASAANQALGATGAAGDYLSGLLIVPATTSPGAVSIKDGGGSSITVFAGGASSVSNLVPFFVPLGIKSTSGAWQVTTGGNVSVIGCGNFT